MEHIQHTVTNARTQVVDADPLPVFQLFNSLHMAFCQVHHMDVVAHSGPIRRVIIIAKYIEMFQLAHCHLGNIRNQVVGDPLWILADQAALMGSDGIKVAQKDHIPLIIRGMQVSEDLLQHSFGASVRIGDLPLRAVLGNGNLGRIPVHGCR